ncbi:MAG: TrkH family potassium uptake protein [Bacillota bacterium]|nr:TrkH family potassium uptake protein [Bacillota bacterium]
MYNIKSIKLNSKSNPAFVLTLGFVFLILIGTIFLALPIASKNGVSVGLINALFTSTSAVCVTGLVVVNTAGYWSVFGKIVIMMLIQVGGLGFMTMATLIAILTGKKIGLKNRILIQESLGQFTIAGVVKLTIRIIQATLIIELVGTIILAIKFIPEFGLKKGLFFGMFHSISAFCNAGFDIIGNSLENYVGNPIINFTIMFLIILGGIGFTVIIDVIKTNKIRKLSLQTKLILVVTLGLLIIGFVFFFIIEYGNPETIGNLPLGDKILASLFQSVTPRTAGFNTVPIGDLRESSKFFTIVLMFIGGSPGSTAGGIKTATLGLILLSVYAEITGKEEVVFAKRRISNETISRAVSILIIALTLVIIVTMILSVSEINFKFIDIFFEVVSAFGTVGLSTGITDGLTSFGKIIITITMFLGRIGPITAAIAIASRHSGNRALIRYPEGKIFVG